ncbi:MAG: hypothetical protein O3A36_03180 [bacterium]|nr:hypothetical protein [bacterium]
MGVVQQYDGLQDVHKQLEDLRGYWADIKSQRKGKIHNFHDGAEWMVTLRPGFLGLCYGEAIERVFRFLSVERGGFVNHRVGMINSRYLQQSKRTWNRFRFLAEQQPNSDTLIFPMQSGWMHERKSALRVRSAFSQTQVCLGVLDVSIYLLTHPNVLATESGFAMICAGDVCGEEVMNRSGKSRFIERVPVFVCDRDEVTGKLELHFDFIPVHYRDAGYCVPTAFLGK